MVTSTVLLSIIVPSRHTGIGAWVNSKMYISILYNIINCHARVFHEKKKKKTKTKTNLDLLSIPRLWGVKTNTEYTGSLGYNSVFRVCYITSIDVDVILDTYHVCVFSSHPFWISSSLDVPAGVTQEEGHTGLLIHLPSAVRALIFVARRIQPFLSLVDREVEFCVVTN